MVEKKEDKIEEKESEEKKKSQKKFENQQLVVIVVVMIILIGVIIGSYWISKSLKSFDFGGFEFQRVEEGTLETYQAKLISRLPDGTAYDFTLILRNDPRKLKNIPIGVERIRLSNDGLAYISLNPNVIGCETTGVALLNMGVFFKAVGVQAKTGSTDAGFAEENNISRITCDDATEDNTIMLVAQSDENSIKQLTENCYEINFKDCDILKSTERFIVGTLAHSKRNFDI